MYVKCVILGHKIKPRITHYRHNQELDLDVQYHIPRLMSWLSEKHTTHFLKECSFAVQRDSKNRVFCSYWINYPNKISPYQAYQHWMMTNITRAFQKCMSDFLQTSVDGFIGPWVAKMWYFGLFALRSQAILSVKNLSPPKIVKVGVGHILSY